VAVPTRVLTTDPALIVRLARAGVGLAMTYDAQVRDELARGELVLVLDDYATPFPGFYLYYPQRQHASPALRAFVAYLQDERRSRRGERARRKTAREATP
jgi:DNA-binding transcriptional LysR family regulator